MAFEVIVPQMGESVLEGTIVEWKVSEGDKVKVNQPLVEIMTDKVNVEIPSEVDGIIEKLLVKSGDIVPVGKVICTITASGSVPAAKEEPKKAETPAQKAAPAAAAAPAPATKAASTGKIPTMAPAVRKLVRDFDLDASTIVATGPDGRLTMDDVKNAAAAKSPVAGVKPPTPAPSQIAAPAPAAATIASQPAARPAKPMPGYTPPALYSERVEEKIPVEGARKSIADHMVRSKAISPHVTTFEDCDFTALVEFRNKHKDSFLQTYGAKLTFMPFIMKAAIEGLKEFPNVNASMTDTEITIKKYYNIGMAVARENGLIVPVLKDADKKSIIDLAVEITSLGEKARKDQLKLDDVQGGTFTLTNAGMFGATASTPVINQPQVAILGIHNISEKPVVRDGQIVIRHMSTFGMSFDHRLIDGHTAVQFLHRTIEYLEDPTRLLLRLR